MDHFVPFHITTINDQLLPPSDDPYRRVTRQSNRKSAMEQKEQLKARRERAKKQTLLRVERSKRLTALLEETGGNLIDKKNENEWKDPKVYSDNLDLPKNHNDKLMVDIRNEALICPIMDHFVPFHITTINDQLLPPSDDPYRRVTRQSNRKSAMEQKEQLKARRERAKKQTLLRVERSKRLTALLEETGGNLIDKRIFIFAVEQKLQILCNN